MPAEKTTQTFRCTQVQLYIIALMGWNFCLEQIAAFELFDARYTKQLINEAIAAVNAAKALKNIQQRNLVTSLNRNESIVANEAVCLNWQSLKRYIDKAYKGQTSKNCQKAAGDAFYLKAAANDWSSVVSLIENSTAFIDEKKNDLMTRGGMPAGFVSKFMDAAAICMDGVSVFKTSVRKKNEQTVSKQDANKAVYESLRVMLADGQDIFKKDNKGLRNNFVFEKLYEVAKANSPASLRGYLTDENGQPVVGVTLQIEKTELMAVSNKKGYYRFGRLAAGNCTVKMVKAGFSDKVEDVVLKPGTAKLLNETMQKTMANELRKVEAA